MLKNHKIKIWLVVGAVGLVSFILLRDQISFQAQVDKSLSRGEVEQKTRALSRDLGFSMDSLAVLYHHIIDLKQSKHLDVNELPSTAGGWKVIIGEPVDDWVSLTHDPTQLYRQYGYLELTYTRWGSVYELRAKSNALNPTFVAQDSLLAAVRFVLGKSFGYNLEHFSLEKVREARPTSDGGTDSSINRSGSTENFSGPTEGTTFLWQINDKTVKSRKPVKLSLEVIPKFRRAVDSLQQRYEYGISISSFEARYEKGNHQNKTTATPSNISLLLNYAALTIILGFLLFLGFKQIFRGQVDWRRMLLVMMITGIMYFLGRSIYLMDMFGTFISGGAEAVILVGQLVGSVVFGLFAGLAYVGWEALARDQKQEQLGLVDAYWRKRFFYRESGEAILLGFGLGLTLTGLFTVFMYFSGLWYYQESSLFYHTLNNTSYPWLSLPLTLVINSIVVALAILGLIRSYLTELISNRYLNFSVVLLVISIVMLSPGLFTTNGSLWQEFLLLLLLTAVLIYVYDHLGIVTLLVTWLSFTGILLTSLLWNSDSIELVLTSWGFAGFSGLLFLFALAAYHYGNSIEVLDGYVPEYEERLAHQMRVEKEIEIARESQFKLMPVQAPDVKGVDIYGFFMPSFEVGGDYFDYVPCNSTGEEEDAIAFAIADVSGKAMKAAMQAVFTSGLLLSRLHKDSPATILREISPTIYHRTDPKTFITCLIGRYEVESKRLTIANAGHCRPILKRDQQASYLYTEDPKYPLGVRGEVGYREKQFKLNSGDFVLLYSDGMPEAKDNDGNYFGYDNLLKLVENIDTDNKSAQEIALELRRHIQKYSDHQLADDTTLICLKI